MSEAFLSIGGVFAGFNGGVKAFFSAANAAGGIAGYQIKLTSFDDAGDPGNPGSVAQAGAPAV